MKKSRKNRKKKKRHQHRQNAITPNSDPTNEQSHPVPPSKPAPAPIVSPEPVTEDPNDLRTIAVLCVVIIVIFTGLYIWDKDQSVFHSLGAWLIEKLNVTL